jgi:hypothetical protein
MGMSTRTKSVPFTDAPPDWPCRVLEPETAAAIVAALESWVGRRVEIVGLDTRRLVGPLIGLPPGHVYIEEGAGWWAVPIGAIRAARVVGGPVIIDAGRVILL